MKKKLSYKIALYSAIGVLSAVNVFATTNPTGRIFSEREKEGMANFERSTIEILSTWAIFKSTGNEREDAEKVRNLINSFVKGRGDPGLIWFFLNHLEEHRRNFIDLINSETFRGAKPSDQLNIIVRWCAREEMKSKIVTNLERRARGEPEGALY